jgi:hypothetical protein
MAQLKAAFTELANQKSASTGTVKDSNTKVTVPRIYVDCIAPNASDLSGIVDQAAAALADQFGAQDIRCAPKDSPLGFGGWKGALAAYIREGVELQPGDYYLDTRGSEIREIAAEAFGTLVVARGIR